MTQGDHIGDESPPDPEQLSEHAAKASRRQTAWKEQECALRNRFYDRVHVNVARAGRRVEAKREQLQLEVDESWMGHQCSNSPLHPQHFRKELDGEITYFGLDCVCQLRMVKWTCTCCSQTFSPHALDFGCFPSTPTPPHVWYDLQVLWMHKRLGLPEGLSATGGEA